MEFQTHLTTLYSTLLTEKKIQYNIFPACKKWSSEWELGCGIPLRNNFLTQTQTKVLLSASFSCLVCEIDGVHEVVLDSLANCLRSHHHWDHRRHTEIKNALNDKLGLKFKTEFFCLLSLQQHSVCLILI